ncbi:HXXEE domain-containing protein [Stomatohabitans albus]|uniref:HXXEE domain-containing protein n=1 Tax=Stomatohabitans albus TaxID=3110766 RepID=UPI00300D38C9
MNGRLEGRDRWLVPLSLWGSFLANDGEEWLTMARTAPAVYQRLGVSNRVPEVVRQPSQRHVNVGVSVIGLLLAVAVIDGIRSRGRGWLYQDVQMAFGAHGWGHLLSAMVSRGYVTGVLTSPTVVLPQWWWARRRLRAAGVPTTSRPLRAAGLCGAGLLAAHALGIAASRRRTP